MGTSLALWGEVARASSVYQPRRPEQGALHQVVRDHFETFRAEAEATRDGQGLPRFVEREFRDFLTCGCLAAGFARFRCASCRKDRLVPFSCKGRGFCPSCGGRRMTDRAAHLVDHVFPQVPVRQWVLSLPPRLRYALAFDHTLCRAVVAVFVRGILAWLRRRAERGGVPDGRGGGVAIVQRFGAALNLNVHIHALIMDGVFVADGADSVRFCPATPVGEGELAVLLGVIERRLVTMLARRGITDGRDGVDVPDPWSEETPALAGLVAASVCGVRALGPRAGRPVRRWGDAIDLPDPPAFGRWHARRDGFDLHAGISVPATARDRLERLCRYALRPPLERLAALIPRPRINLVLYHGVLAPRAAWRARVVPARIDEASTASAPEATAHRHGRPANRTWADLMQRSFGFDVLACPHCSGRLTLVALIQAPAVIERILTHLGFPVDVPAMQPSRAPPLPLDGGDDQRFRGDD